MEFPLTAQDRDYFQENVSSNYDHQTETINQKKLKLVGLITELEREMRQLENKIEEIKSIVYHL